MSSTEFKADREDMLFVVNEVFKAGKLTEYSAFEDYDQDLFGTVVNGACEFAEKALAPCNEIGDREGSRLIDGKVVSPEPYAKPWKQFGEDGWLGLDADPEYGGQGLPVLVAVAAREAMFAANPALYLGPMLTTGAANLVYTFGSDEQKSKYCENMFTGVWSGTMCLTEPAAGSFLADITTTAVKDGDSYLIKGTKQFITWGDHGLNDNVIHLVLARTPDGPPGIKGISLFIVPKMNDDGSHNDVKTVSIEHKMGIHGSPTCVLSFGDEGTCRGELLAEENKGMMQMFKLMNEARLQVGTQGLGAASAGYHFAHAYANERIQGASVSAPKGSPQGPIVEHPDVKRMLMDMKATTEGLRCLNYACGYYTDMAHHGPEETRKYYQNLLDLYIPLSKSFCTDKGYQVASEGIQVLGGAGFLKDFPSEQVARDVKIAAIYEGTNGIQSIDLIGRKFAINNGELLESFQKEMSYFDENPVSDDLKGLHQEWQSYREMLDESFQKLRDLRQEGGMEGYLLYSMSMLNLMSDVVCGFFLLKEAVISENKLKELGTNFHIEESELAKYPNAGFYWDKVRTVEYFMYSVLPRALSHARIIKNGNLTALKARLKMD